MNKRYFYQKTTGLWASASPAVWAVLFEGLFSVTHASGGGEHSGTPFSYLLAWIMLMLVCATALKGWGSIGGREGTLLAKGHEKPHHPPPFQGSIRSLSLLLVIMVFILLLVEISVGHYNEGVVIGLVRTGLKMTVGVMLMFFGIAFMHEEHDEHGEDNTSETHH
jgi:hypothetical protein